MRIVSLILLSILVSACSHTSPRYAPSASNQEQLRQVSSTTNYKIATSKFTSTEPGKTSIMCRAAGPIEAPDGKSFEDYIQDSLTNELKMSGLYSDSSTQKLSGNLELIDFNSNIGAGKWIMRMTFTWGNAAPFTVENTYKFSTNFIADIACEQVAQALPAATQDFIAKVFQDPGFRNYLSDKSLAKANGAAISQ